MKRIIEININYILSILILVLCVGCMNEKKEAPVTIENNSLMKSQQSLPQDQQEVKAIIEKFLVVAGNYDLEAMKAMMLDGANLGVSRFQDSTWMLNTLMVADYLNDAKTQKLTPYYEPIGDYKIQLTDGQIAFVWDDAVLHRFGIPESKNITNFILLKKEGQWKFHHISFTKIPLPQTEMKFDMETFARGYAQVWSGKSPDFVAMFFEEKGSLRVNENKPAKGREQIAAIAKGFMTDLPGMIVSFDSIVNKTAGTEFHWTLTATNSGPGGAGKKVKVSGFELWQMGENGRILSSQGHFPTAEYNRQLGIEN